MNGWLMFDHFLLPRSQPKQRFRILTFSQSISSGGSRKKERASSERARRGKGVCPNLPLLANLVEFGNYPLPVYLLFIATMGRVAELSESNFDTILQAEVPVLVDFWSPTCAPCRTLVPILEELAEENEGDATIVKVNTAEYPALVIRFVIDTLPTLLFFYQGRVVERMTGVQSKHKIQAAWDEIE